MTWTVVQFGRYKGRTLPQILFIDPDWFYWAMEQATFDNRGATLKSEADDLYYKSRHILIPNNTDGSLVAEYYVDPPTGKFSHFDVVPAARPPHIGSSPTFRSNVIDMSVPRQIARYDKLGCKHLISSLKHLVFGSAAAKVTRRRAEDFFEAPQHFA